MSRSRVRALFVCGHFVFGSENDVKKHSGYKVYAITRLSEEIPGREW